MSEQQNQDEKPLQQEKPPLPQGTREYLRYQNDRAINVFADLVRREHAMMFLGPADEAVALATICITDLAYVLQTAEKGLYQAQYYWALHEAAGHLNSKKGRQRAIVESRHHFDFGLIALCAASNHLASAMWHFHESVPEPLGKKYKSAAQARDAWRSKAAPHESLGILSRLLDHPDWKIVNEYRDNWIHRGLPILNGENRIGRRRVWQQPGAPAPPAYFATSTASDGRVMYLVQGDESTFEVPSLLPHARSAQDELYRATREFLVLLDTLLASRGIALTKNGVQVTYHAPPPPEQRTPLEDEEGSLR